MFVSGEFMYELIVYSQEKKRPIFRGRYDDLDIAIAALVPFATEKYVLYLQRKDEDV